MTKNANFFKEMLGLPDFAETSGQEARQADDGGAKNDERGAPQRLRVGLEPQQPLGPEAAEEPGGGRDLG